MELNWIIIGSVVLLGIFLILRNSKDEKDVIEHFNKNASIFPDVDSEFNDEK